MTEFLETSVMVVACSPYHARHLRARLLLGSPYVTCNRVVSELLNVHDRRKKLYGRVIGYDPKPGSTVEDLRAKWFRAAAEGHRNDTQHLDEFFFAIMNAEKLSLDDTVDGATVQRLRRSIFRLVSTMKIQLGRLCKDLETDPAYKDHHIVVPNPTNKSRRLRASLLDKIPDARRHKDDLDIAADAFAYCIDTGAAVEVMTLDGYLVTHGSRIRELSFQSYGLQANAFTFDIVEVT